MCRHLAYLGPPIALADALLAPEHSLLHQSWAPRDMRCGGTVNADGFGAGWYPTGSDAPVRYRRDRPLWTDNGFAELAASVHSAAFIAAVRSATVGMPIGEAACAPFSDGRMLFSHNGVVDGWPSSMASLAARLDVTDLLTMDAPTDSALLWALIRSRLRSGADPVAAVAGVAAEVLAAAPASRLNLLLTDGSLVVATTWWHALSVRQDDDAVLIASEPLDDHPAWVSVPDARLLVARRTPTGKSTVDITPLDITPLDITPQHDAAPHGPAPHGPAPHDDAPHDNRQNRIPPVRSQDVPADGPPREQD